MIFCHKGNIKETLREIEKLFDIVRVVHPITNKVLCLDSPEDRLFYDGYCYDFWETGRVCDNCTALEVVSQKRVATKISNKSNELYIVISCPIKIDNNIYVLECLKNITETSILAEGSEIGSRTLLGTVPELSEKTIRDDLTGVYNRRYINYTLSDNIRTAMENKLTYTFVMLDIDDFKNINDSYGYVAGDIALKRLADIIGSEIRSGYDWVARYGGDEFFISLKNIDSQSAIKIVDRIRKSVEEQVISFEDRSFSITISAGLYTLKDDECRCCSDVICQADRNLKRAKDRGKNMIIAS